MLVHALISKRAVEAFNKRVLDRLPRLDEVPPYPVLLAEILDTDASLGVLQCRDDLLFSMAFSGHGLLFLAHGSTVELHQWSSFLGEGHYIQGNQRMHIQESRTGSTGTVIAVVPGLKMVTVSNHTTIRRCTMNKNSILLSIGAALLLSLFLSDVGHAVQIDRKQGARNLMAMEMNKTTNAPTTQVSSMPKPCKGDGMRRTGGPCRQDQEIKRHIGLFQ